MSNNLAASIFLVVSIMGLAVFSWNPFNIFMSDATAMAIACILLIVVAVFVAIVWREHASDEREVVHLATAGRIAFLVGVAVVTTGVVAQSFVHAVDPWLVGALVAMVLAKIGARAWSEMKN